ncbi:uncharacterized protein I206_104595 [Kwoniella pini CBS 10737]|uniref:Uncharacterized protein n=1 Tax=Kwoniella pini CBS 10737 TaxID=1296096 RepID=A0A1B9I797_9TREE|nr:uncharacterized protein I206_02129 [Kwoniella pini CBS 10737]OCF51415.1 hypothetical protein I206_02129 [Kwoniella pini CBS 10737]
MSASSFSDMTRNELRQKNKVTSEEIRTTYAFREDRHLTQEQKESLYYPLDQQALTRDYCKHDASFSFRTAATEAMIHTLLDSKIKKDVALFWGIAKTRWEGLTEVERSSEQSRTEFKEFLPVFADQNIDYCKLENGMETISASIRKSPESYDLTELGERIYKVEMLRKVSHDIYDHAPPDLSVFRLGLGFDWPDEIQTTIEKLGERLLVEHQFPRTKGLDTTEEEWCANQYWQWVVESSNMTERPTPEATGAQRQPAAEPPMSTRPSSLASLASLASENTALLPHESEQTGTPGWDCFPCCPKGDNRS